MRLVRAVAVLGIVAPLALGCSSSPTPSGPSGEKSSATPAPAASAAIEQSGFGGPGKGYVWVTSTVRGVPVGQFATVSFNLYGADGALLATESQTEQAVNPD